MTVELNMFQTAVAGLAALLLGWFFNNVFGVLKRVCIPAPVTGGLVMSLAALSLYVFGDIEINFDVTLKDICMVAFFTTVGFQANLRSLKSGGRAFGVMCVLVAVLVLLQNFLGIGISKAFGINPLVGLAAGSSTMCGGHGTAVGFSSMFESGGLGNASTILLAAATFGLLGGALLGGPVAEMLIRIRHLAPAPGAGERPSPSSEGVGSADTKKTVADFLGSVRCHKVSDLALSLLWIAVAAGLGNLISRALSLTGFAFPTYFGALVAAAIIRNLTESVKRIPHPPVPEILAIGNVALALFLGMAMVSLRLWELKALALPLSTILAGQIVLMALYAIFVAFPALGGDYDAAVLVSGLCGFGLGATPNAMANMSAVCGKYRYSVTAFIVVPVVGAMAVDVINIAVITIFLNIVG